jgi:L-ascorbate metabolism protein UlaG (beta-lactamase superfamily)
LPRIPIPRKQNRIDEYGLAARNYDWQNNRWAGYTIASIGAAYAPRDLGARYSIGMHFGTFQLTSVAIDQPLADLERARVEYGVPEADFVTLQEGNAIFRIDLP